MITHKADIEYTCLDKETGYYEFVVNMLPDEKEYLRLLGFRGKIPRTLYDIYANSEWSYHNLKGPARWCETSGHIEYESYYVNGVLHRLDGPAVVNNKRGNKVKQFYVDGVKYNTEIEYWIAVEKYLKL